MVSLMLKLVQAGSALALVASHASVACEADALCETRGDAAVHLLQSNVGRHTSKKAASVSSVAKSAEQVKASEPVKVAAGECVNGRRYSRTPGDVSKPIIWLHLHKYGGTTMCNLAKEQGELAPGFEPMNCNFMGDVCSQDDPDRQVLCAERVDSGMTFSGVERMVLEGDLNCSSALYGIALRDPIYAAESALVSDFFTEEEKDAVVKSMDTHVIPEINPGHGCLPAYDTYQHADNFAVRTLCGRYNAAPGTLTDADLDVAKAILKKMDVITILEEVDTHVPQLEHMFGWRFDGDKMPQHNPHVKDVRLLSDEDEALLRKHNALDLELFEYGKQLARERSKQAMEQIQC